MRTIFCIAIALGLVGCAPPAADSPTDTTPEVEYFTAGSPDASLPFSPAVRVGDLVFLSGQIGNRPGTLELVEGGLEAEARQTMENIKTTLEGIGLSMAHVVKCTVMIDDIAQWGDFNQVYVDYFPGDKPARSAFGADGLALGAAVEVECIAHAG